MPRALTHRSLRPMEGDFRDIGWHFGKDPPEGDCGGGSLIGSGFLPDGIGERRRLDALRRRHWLFRQRFGNADATVLHDLESRVGRKPGSNRAGRGRHVRRKRDHHEVGHRFVTDRVRLRAGRQPITHRRGTRVLSERGFLRHDHRLYDHAYQFERNLREQVEEHHHLGQHRHLLRLATTGGNRRRDSAERHHQLGRVAQHGRPQHGRGHLPDECQHRQHRRRK